MIFEELCDTEDWSNGCWIFRNKLHFKYIKTVILNSNNISQYYSFYCIFDHIKILQIYVAMHISNIYVYLSENIYICHILRDGNGKMY